MTGRPRQYSALSDEDVNALASCGEEVDALVEDLREASKQVAAIKDGLAGLSSSKHNGIAVTAPIGFLKQSASER